MEISSIFSQTDPTAGMEALLTLVAVACAVAVVANCLLRLVRAPELGRPRLPRIAPLHLLQAALAAAVPVSAAPANAGPLSSQHRPLLSSQHRPPWLETSGFPPPRPLVRAEASRHPAIHPGAGRTARQPLFPRETGPRGIDDLNTRIRRGIIDLRRSEHTVARTPRRAAGHEQQSHYTVMPGDTLWDIAGRVLGTDDVRAIARYWPLIHRENRDVVGPDPNLIRPGMVLSLPRKERA